MRREMLVVSAPGDHGREMNSERKFIAHRMLSVNELAVTGGRGWQII